RSGKGLYGGWRFRRSRQGLTAMHHRETFVLSCLLCAGPIAPQVEPLRRMSRCLRHRHRGVDEEWRRDGDQESGAAEEHDLEEFGETLLLALAEGRRGGRIRNE